MINNIKLLNLKKERKINVKDYGINEMIGVSKTIEINKQKNNVIIYQNF